MVNVDDSVDTVSATGDPASANAEPTKPSDAPDNIRLILLAPPGAGKGTQSRILSRLYNIPHIETGSILRQAMRDGTELGEKAREYMESGNLVPDEIIVKIVRERLRQPDCEEGFILDGYPRTVPQAEDLEAFYDQREEDLDAVVFLDVSDEVIFERLTNRRVCSACGKTYHLEAKPPEREGTCDDCGAELIRREDDYRESIEHRLEVYRDKTQPLLEFYRSRNQLIEVDGEQSIQTVNQAIQEKIRDAVRASGS